jgi:Flp pilus assembly protein TadG
MITEMITALCRVPSMLRNSDASAAVEAAIFLPIFTIFTFGITDLGSGIVIRQQVVAAAQAGATYAVVRSGSASVCASLTATCLTGIQGAMNAAVGNSSFCTGPVCTASITACTDGSPKCISVSANYPLTPILPASVYSWAQSMTVTSTVTVRVM